MVHSDSLCEKSILLRKIGWAWRRQMSAHFRIAQMSAAGTTLMTSHYARGSATDCSHAEK